MHLIKILNFADYEKVNHSFVVIKGCVINSTSDKCTESHDKIFLKIGQHQVSQKFYPQSCIFKFLIELSSGLNNFTLIYCQASLKFCLEYVEQNTHFIVSPLYIICDGHDGRFQAPQHENNSIKSACKRILTGAKLLQCIVSEKLFENNLDRKSFKLEKECGVFYSKLHCDVARKMNQQELWTYFATELINSPLKNNNKKILALLSCTRYQGNLNNKTALYEDVLKQTEGHVALAAGGLALFGSGCLYTWPEDITQVIPRFLNESQVNSNYFMDDSCYRGTLGSCFSTTLGSVLHELCHVFDLGHTEEGIMGRGFDNIYKVFTHSNSRTNKSGVCAEKDRIKFEDDQTYWTKSCMVLLRYHRWINTSVVGKKQILHYDSDTDLIKSTAGIRVVEIRRETDETVMESWIFTSKILKFSFRIPKESFKKLKEQTALVVIEDNIGNIMKKSIPL